MKTRDLTELAARNLREAVLRNSLTTLGIAVGVASLVAMLSLGVGLQELANKKLSKSGLFDAVFVSSKTNQRGMGRQNPPESSAPKEPAKILDNEARQTNRQRSRTLSKFIPRFVFPRRYSSTANHIPLLLRESRRRLKPKALSMA